MPVDTMQDVANEKRLSVPLDEKTYAALEKLADEEMRSMGQQAAYLIKKALEKPKPVLRGCPDKP